MALFPLVLLIFLDFLVVVLGRSEPKEAQTTAASHEAGNESDNEPDPPIQLSRFGIVSPFLLLVDLSMLHRTLSASQRSVLSTASQSTECFRDWIEQGSMPRVFFVGWNRLWLLVFRKDDAMGGIQGRRRNTRNSLLIGGNAGSRGKKRRQEQTAQEQKRVKGTLFRKGKKEGSLQRIIEQV